MPGTMGGFDLDVVTAEAGDILAGRVIVDAEGNPLTGTLKLSGTAGDSQVLSGQTYYNTDAKGKRTGSMANRGALNWSGNNTTYGVPAGFYSGGTLDSRPSYNSGYNAGMTAADARVNVNSANYKAGYNAGVTAADNRVNTASANYKGGYNAGVAAADARTNVNSANYKAGYNAGLAAGKKLNSANFTVTASADKKTWSQGNGSTVSLPYATFTLSGSHVFASAFWSRSDISSGGTEYWMMSSEGSICKMDRTNFIICSSVNGSNWKAATTLRLPVSTVSKPYRITVWYV